MSALPYCPRNAIQTLLKHAVPIKNMRASVSADLYANRFNIMINYYCSDAPILKQTLLDFHQETIDYEPIEADQEYLYERKLITTRSRSSLLLNGSTRSRQEPESFQVNKPSDIDAARTYLNPPTTDLQELQELLGNNKTPTNTFSFFAPKYTSQQEFDAVTALKTALEGRPVEKLKSHLSVLRNCAISQELKQFVKKGRANSICGRNVTTVSDFIDALDTKNKLASHQAPKPQR